jgi:hypothetical protein
MKPLEPLTKEEYQSFFIGGNYLLRCFHCSSSSVFGEGDEHLQCDYIKGRYYDNDKVYCPMWQPWIARFKLSGADDKDVEKTVNEFIRQFLVCTPKIKELFEKKLKGVSYR